MKTYIVNADGLTAREKNIYTNFHKVQHPGFPFDESRKKWSVFESTVQSYPIITDKPLDPGVEIECELVWQLYDHDLKRWEDYAGSLSVTWDKFQSFFRTTRQALEPIEQPKEEKKAPFNILYDRVETEIRKYKIGDGDLMELYTLLDAIREIITVFDPTIHNN